MDGYLHLNLDFCRKCVCIIVMFSQFDPLTPPKMLALAYAKPKYRSGLELILRHDVKLGQIFQNSSEPMIAQMKLAWWRDVISRPLANRPSGEPILTVLNLIEGTEKKPNLAASMIRLVDAWDGLMRHDLWSEQILDDFAEAKSRAIFDYYAKCDGEGIEAQAITGENGKAWVIADLLTYCRNDNEVAAVARAGSRNQRLQRLPSILRPLSILGFAARQDRSSKTAGIRLIIHALTGR